MNKSQTYKLTLLLTSCINPGSTHSVTRRDPAIRLNDYLRSLKFFLQLRGISNIVFCDNSGYDLSDFKAVLNSHNPYQKNVEILSFYGQPSRPEQGKGAGEMQIIHYALNHSNIIRNSDMVMKVTGRLIAANAESIADAVSKILGVDVFCDLRRNLSTSDSRLFCATPHFLRTYFMPFQVVMDESKGICFEDILARAVHRAMADGIHWAMLPYAHDIQGVAATADMPLPSSRWNYASRAIFRAIKEKILSR